MNEPYFELLIYSCSQEAFVERATKEAEKVMAAVPDYGNGFRQEQLADEIKRHSIPVRFNELVGYIEVHAVGSELRADYWFTDKKKIVIGSKSKGTIRPIGKLIEKHYRSSRLSSPDIFDDFRKTLETRVNEHSRLKRRFIDYSVFDRCGPFIDWRRILEL